MFFKMFKYVLVYGRVECGVVEANLIQRVHAPCIICKIPQMWDFLISPEFHFGLDDNSYVPSLFCIGWLPKFV